MSFQILAIDIWDAICQVSICQVKPMSIIIQLPYEIVVTKSDLKSLKTAFWGISTEIFRRLFRIAPKGRYNGSCDSKFSVTCILSPTGPHINFKAVFPQDVRLKGNFRRQGTSVSIGHSAHGVWQNRWQTFPRGLCRSIHAFLYL